MRPLVVLGLLGLAIGCSRSPVLVPGDDTTGVGSSSASEAGDDGDEGEPMPRVDLALDLPAPLKSCEALGGTLGVVDGPRQLLPAAEERSHLGLSVLADGALLTFVEPTPAGALDVFALALEGVAGVGEPAPIWAVPHPLPDLAVGTDGGALLMACGAPPSWAFVGADGRPVGAELVGASPSACIAPAVAPVPLGALVGWLHGCRSGTCMRIVATTADSIASEPPLAYEASPIALRLVGAAAEDTAMFAAITTEFLPTGDVRARIVAQLVDHDAMPLFPTFRIEVPVSPDEPFVDWPLGLAAAADGGYAILVGRWGGGLGRMRFDAQGTPLEELVELELPADAPADGAYAVSVALARRPGGFWVLGDAGGPEPGMLATALDERGEASSSIFVPDVPSDVAWAEDGERVLVAWDADGVQVVALGCVP